MRTFEAVPRVGISMLRCCDGCNAVCQAWGSRGFVSSDGGIRNVAKTMSLVFCGEGGFLGRQAGRQARWAVVRTGKGKGALAELCKVQGRHVMDAVLLLKRRASYDAKRLDQMLLG